MILQGDCFCVKDSLILYRASWEWLRLCGCVKLIVQTLQQKCNMVIVLVEISRADSQLRLHCHCTSRRIFHRRNISVVQKAKPRTLESGMENLSNFLQILTFWTRSQWCAPCRIDTVLNVLIKLLVIGRFEVDCVVGRYFFLPRTLVRKQANSCAARFCSPRTTSLRKLSI